MSTPPVVIVGAGAAGLMAGIFAARSGAPTLLVEGTADGGRKILISGGGRCNVLPGVARPDRFVTASSPNTLKKILRSWPLDEQRQFFETDLGIPLKREAEFDKLFPVSDRAADVRDALVAAYTEAGGKFWTGVRVTGLTPPGDGPGADDGKGPGEGSGPGERSGPQEGSGPGEDDGDPGATWKVALDSGRTVEARAVVLATGGRSVPKTGSDGWGLDAATELGHTLRPVYPALTPLLADPCPHADLAGLTLPVRITAPGARPRFDIVGSFLFTHRGYSGPAALDASHLVTRTHHEHQRQPLIIQWSPDLDGEAWERLLTRGGGGTVGAEVRRHLPNRLADQLVREAGVDSDRPLAGLPRNERKRLLGVLAAYPLPVTGDEGYKKAEVTGGGVALEEIHPGTMESRLAPGLFLCGEILDAFGPIGGHNFYWAWATGRAAGAGAAQLVGEAHRPEGT